MAPRKTKTFNRDKLIRVIRETLSDDVPLFYHTNDHSTTMDRFMRWCVIHDIPEAANNKRPWVSVRYDREDKQYIIEHFSNGNTFTLKISRDVKTLKVLRRMLQQSDERRAQFVANMTCGLCSERVSNLKEDDSSERYTVCSQCYNKVCLDCVCRMADAMEHDEELIRCPFCREELTLSRSRIADMIADAPVKQCTTIEEHF